MLFGLAFFFLLQIASSGTPLEQPANQSAASRPETSTSEHQPSEVIAPPTAEDRIADYTLALTWLTGLMAVVAMWQGWNLNKTLGQMKASEERQLRAYVFVEDISTDGPAEFGYPHLVRYMVRIKNSGQTPAYDLTWESNVQIVENSLPGGFPDLITPDKPSRVSVPPQSLANASITPKQFNRDGETALTAGTHGVYYFGLIKYRDAFGKNRWTKFRYYRERGTNRFMACEDGNDSN